MHRTLVLVAVTLSLLAAPGPLDSLWSLVQLQLDNGCGMDPWGGCHTTPQAQLDNGCGWDPFGCPNS